MIDVGDIRPTSLGHIVGQRGVVDQVRVALDAAHQDGRKVDHALLVGPPGVGKTATAQVIAAEMATDFIEVLGQSLADAADLSAVLLSATNRAVILVDEAHELDKALQTSLYLALDQKKILLPAGKRGGTPAAVPLNDFTLLLATTDEYDLLPPLRDRMRLTLRFGFYGDDELGLLLRQRVRALGWRVQEDVLPAIAARSRGTPRLALRLLQAAHRVSRAEGEQAVTAAHLVRACDLEQIDGLGLGPTERHYLDILTGGATRLNVIGSLLGLPARTVSEVVEPYLIRSGLVTKDDQGRRQLTAAGRGHVTDRHQNHVEGA